MEDFLVLRPYSNLEILYGELQSSNIKLLKRSDLPHESEFACVIGPRALPLYLDGKLNYFGHEVLHYVRAINQHIDISVRREIIASIK